MVGRGERVPRGEVTSYHRARDQLLFADTGPHAGYRLLAHGSPLEERDTKLAHQIHLALSAACHRVPVGRVTHGWNAPHELLLAPPSPSRLDRPAPAVAPRA